MATPLGALFRRELALYRPPSLFPPHQVSLRNELTCQPGSTVVVAYGVPIAVSLYLVAVGMVTRERINGLLDGDHPRVPWSVGAVVAIPLAALGPSLLILFSPIAFAIAGYRLLFPRLPT